MKKKQQPSPKANLWRLLDKNALTKVTGGNGGPTIPDGKEQTPTPDTKDQ